MMPFKFEKLEVWLMALDYCDSMYELADKLPDKERFNLQWLWCVKRVDKRGVSM
jgi:hypothetical protein